MALSDYLTGDEWDACFYASMGQCQADNFGESMRKTIQCLLDRGYVFPGLDETGSKLCQVEGGVNAPKICIFLGNPHNVDVLGCLENGRDFLKRVAAELVGETDEEWVAQMEEAREDQS